eukprot:TRINITY_DN6811_c0_g1_i1.p1 TRINITY_DN6811_c0_g1~~TRINITY_DN6811_c0_g1_i1.p1  ORF type:complete len:171 (+),score=23.98 TRINITY_DN6811_c0_g1_i1:36-548(+)
MEAPTSTKNGFVFFWRPNEKNGQFSQWWMSDFTVDGVVYCCAEQYMMAMKAALFGDDKMQQLIMKERNPKEHQKMGKRVSNFDNDVWNENKSKIVFDASVAKFSQDPELREYILSTGEKTLVEASPSDTIWGIGLQWNHKDATNPSRWRGTNLLGKALMQARTHIRENKL